MSDSNAFEAIMPAGVDRPANLPAPSRDILTEILHEGAQRLLAQAIDAEVSDWIDRHAEVLDDDGHRQVVRNGHHPTRTILTGVGSVEVTQPRVHDRRIAGVDEDGQAIDGAGQPLARFRSSILPPYLRKTKAIEELIPWLYLKGVSTGGFTEALQALVGPQAAGLSAGTITRLIGVEDGYRESEPSGPSPPPLGSASMRSEKPGMS